MTKWNICSTNHIAHYLIGGNCNTTMISKAVIHRYLCSGRQFGWCRHTLCETQYVFFVFNQSGFEWSSLLWQIQKKNISYTVLDQRIYSPFEARWSYFHYLLIPKMSQIICLISMTHDSSDYVSFDKYDSVIHFHMLLYHMYCNYFSHPSYAFCLFHSFHSSFFSCIPVYEPPPLCNRYTITGIVLRPTLFGDVSVTTRNIFPTSGDCSLVFDSMLCSCPETLSKDFTLLCLYII